MLKYVAAIYKWILRKETLSNALFAIRISKVLFTDKSSRGARSLAKVEELLRKVAIAQQAVDKHQQLVPNNETATNVNVINQNVDRKLFGDFSARVEKDRHGPGNDGIKLGLKTTALGVDVDLGYDPSNGSADFKLGPLALKL